MTLEEIERLSRAELIELAWVQELKLRTYGNLLKAVPPCPAHGESCIAHAIQWVDGARMLLAKMEAAIAQ